MTTYQLHIEATGQHYDLTVGHIASAMHRYVDGGLYDLAESFDSVGDGAAWITQGHKVLTTEQLDSIRDAEITAGR